MFALSSLPGIVDRDAHLEVRDVVALDAHRGNLRHLALERALLERLDADARRLAEPQVADFGLVDPPAHEHVRDVAHRDDRRRRRAHVENRRHGTADLDVARENASANRRADRRVGELFLGALDSTPASARRSRTLPTRAPSQSTAATRRPDGGSRPGRAACALPRAGAWRSASARTGSSPARASAGRTRPRGLRLRRGSFRAALLPPAAPPCAPCSVARASRTRAIRFSRSSSTSTVPASTS